MSSIPATLNQPSSQFITAFSGLSAPLSHADHLEYHLYGAKIYMGLGSWERAIEFLEIVITAPTMSGTSKIMVAAYKKWLLANLIFHGQVCPST
jgi:COP9 signalosome complex subunit 3